MWYFLSPQIYFGADALEALDELRTRRTLIVTDRVVRGLGLVEPVRRRLERAGSEVIVFDDVEPEPSVEAALRGAAVASDFGPDWLVGVGGGSAMDAAKAAWVLYERPDLQPGAISPALRLDLRRKARLATVPTTSGTGSEVTMGIVLTDTQEKRKLGLGNRENMADVAIVDPMLAASMPPGLTAETGLDALAHAVEAYTCTWHNDLADGHCLRAARLVCTFLPRALQNGADLEARERMANAATSAGLALNNSMASLAHAMGHVLGASFHIPHGRAVALALPATIEFAAAEAPERFADLAIYLGLSGSEAVGGARALAAYLRSLAREVGCVTSLAGAGVGRQTFERSLEQLVDDAFNDTQIVTSVRSPSYAELGRLFQYLWTGQPVDF